MPKNSSMFYMCNGILKIKTRILMREDTKRFRYPIVLPYDHSEIKKFTFIRHIILNLDGVKIFMNNLREDFLILKYR